MKRQKGKFSRDGRRLSLWKLRRPMVRLIQGHSSISCDGVDAYADDKRVALKKIAERGTWSGRLALRGLDWLLPAVPIAAGTIAVRWRVSSCGNVANSICRRVKQRPKTNGAESGSDLKSR